MWIDEYAQHEKLRGLVLNGDSETLEMCCPECGATQSCPLEDFDIDEFAFFHLDSYCPSDPDASRPCAWAALWDDENDLGSYTLNVFVPRQEAWTTIRPVQAREGERIASRDEDDLALFVARVIVPALLARLRQGREEPETLRVFVSVEWQLAWKGIAA